MRAPDPRHCSRFSFRSQVSPCKSTSIPLERKTKRTPGLRGSYSRTRRTNINDLPYRKPQLGPWLVAVNMEIDQWVSVPDPYYCGQSSFRSLYLSLEGNTGATGEEEDGPTVALRGVCWNQHVVCFPLASSSSGGSLGGHGVWCCCHHCWCCKRACRCYGGVHWFGPLKNILGATSINSTNCKVRWRPFALKYPHPSICRKLPPSGTRLTTSSWVWSHWSHIFQHFQVMWRGRDTRMYWFDILLPSLPA